ncbi:C-C chemokine receptor type 8-like [Mytilus edulis]|nr:Hypothetical predicted protein [Mytilus galloprovincialis]
MFPMEEINFAINYTESDDLTIDASPAIGDKDTLLIIMDCLVNVFVLLLNISLAVLILCHSKIRQQLFYWRVLNLCLSDLIVGVLVLPFGISYTHNYAWLHGHVLCQTYVILDVTHFGFSSLVITTMCADRFLSKILELYPDKLQIIKFVQLFLFIMPWLFTLCVFLPLLLSSVKTMGVVFRHTCGFILHDDMLVPTAVVAYLIPNLLLILTTVIMLIIYKVKRPVWYRLDEPEAPGSHITPHLRSSTIATLIVSCITMLFWFPYLVNMFIMVTCRSHRCFPGLEVFKATLILCTLTSLFTPCLWLSDDEIRTAAKQSVRRIRAFCLKPLVVREQQYNEHINEEDL